MTSALLRVAPEELQLLLYRAARNRGAPEKDADSVADHYWEAEVRGKSTHGLSKFLYESQYFKDRLGNVELIAETGPIIRFDGNREIGPIAALQVIRECSTRAKRYGICLAAISNIQRFGMLRPWAELFIQAEVFGIVLSTCERAMAPLGGTSKVLGSNPIAFAIPTMSHTYVADLATSKVAMSTIWSCLDEGRLLPAASFFDAAGKYTRDPSRAKAVRGFGGYKGYALSLLIQMITGPVTGFASAGKVKSMYDIGYVFLGVDPTVFQTYAEFLNNATDLVDEIKAARRAHQTAPIVLPGEHSDRYKELVLARGWLPVSRRAWGEVREIAQG